MIRKCEKAFLLFLIVSVIGWLYEVFLEVVVYGWGFSNRGVLTGPYCPVYGFGALIILVCTAKLMKRKICVGKMILTPILVFCAVVVIATVTELVASYIMEWCVGDWMWDYTRFNLNFEGRIALNPSLRFGVGGMVFLYVIYPQTMKLFEKIKPKTMDIIAFVSAIIFVTDCVFRIVEIAV